MLDVYTYVQGADRPTVARTLRDATGQDTSSWTFTARIGQAGGAAVLEKTTGITGGAGGGYELAWSSGELDTVPPGHYAGVVLAIDAAGNTWPDQWGLVVLPTVLAAAAEPQEFSLGDVADAGAGSATVPLGWDDARTLTITHPDIGEPATVEVAARNITGPAGCILWHRGADGTNYWDDGQQETDLLGPLEAAGYRLVQCRWVDPWIDAPAGQRLGAHIMAARPVTLVDWVRDTYAAGVPFGYVGHSNGANIIAYAMAAYGLTGVHTAVMSGGPPYADLTLACSLTGPDGVRLTGVGGGNFVDRSSGYQGDGTGPCYLGDPSIDDAGAIWEASSLLSYPVPAYAWPGTRVGLLQGSEDDLTQGDAELVRQRLAAAGTDYTYSQIPGADHAGVTGTRGGRRIIRAAVLDRARPGCWAAATAQTGPVTVVLREVPAVGDLVVALRAIQAGIGVVTTAEGRQRVDRSLKVPGAPRAAVIEWWVAGPGAPGQYTFELAVEAPQTAIVLVAKGLSSPILADAGNASVSAATSIDLSAGATSDDTIAVGLVQLADPSGPGAWTGEFDVLATGADYAAGWGLLTVPGPSPTSLSWADPVDAAGLLATFRSA